STGYQTVGDTWTWDGSTWTQITASPSPPARFGAVMAYDALSGAVVLFGGADDHSDRGDTWSFTGVGWTQPGGAGAVTRLYGGMAYDAGHGALVQFGGIGGCALPGGYTCSDTWTWAPLTPVVTSIAPINGDPAGGT